MSARWPAGAWPRRAAGTSRCRWSSTRIWHLRMHSVPRVTASRGPLLVASASSHCQCGSAVGRVLQHVQDADHHAVVERDVGRVALRIRIALRKSAVGQLRGQHEIEAAQASLAPGVLAGHRVGPGQVVDLRMDVVVVERRVRASCVAWTAVRLLVGEHRQHVVILRPAAVGPLKQQDVADNLGDLRSVGVRGLIGQGLDDALVVANVPPMVSAIAKARRVDRRTFSVRSRSARPNRARAPRAGGPMPRRAPPLSWDVVPANSPVRGLYQRCSAVPFKSVRSSVPLGEPTGR